MRFSLAILSILASTVVADDVVSFFWPGGYDGVDPVATITKANPTATGMRIACPTNLDGDDEDDFCGWGNGLDVSIIDNTKYQATMKGDSYDMSIDCDWNSKASKMSCTANLDDQTRTTGILSGSDLTFVTASVVQGASLLSPATTMAGATASASASQAAQSSVPKITTSASATGTAVASEATNSASATSSHSASGPQAPESTGAAARFGIEGSALLVLAGAAALNAW